MTVKEIIRAYLIDNDYDGLWTDDCGCFLDDLFPCDCEGIERCQAGYKCKLLEGDGIGPEKENETETN